VTTIEGRCRLAAGDPVSALALLARSRPIIRARWPATSLYGARVDLLLAGAQREARARAPDVSRLASSGDEG
jgi:hypothetical protein